MKICIPDIMMMMICWIPAGCAKIDKGKKQNRIAV
jgi:hypothetical protein